MFRTLVAESARAPDVVDPAARTLEVFRREGERWLLLGAYGEDALVRAEPFDAIEIDLLRFWGMRREPAPT